MNKYQLEVTLSGPAGEPVEGATVTAEPEAAGESARAAFDPQRQTYFFNGLRPGFFTLTIRHPDFLEESSRVQVQPRPTALTFALVPRTSAYTFRGDSRVPYESRPDLLGIIPTSGGAEADNAETVGRSLDDLLSALGLVPEEAPPVEDSATGEGRPPRRAAVPGALIVRRQSLPDADAETTNNDLRVLRESPLVEAAGPLFNQSGAGFTVFTNRLTVRFRPEVTRAEVKGMLADEDLSIVETLPFAANAFVAEAPPSVGEGINGIAERLLATGRVVYAEPNLADAPELDQIIPNDFLWPGVWDRQLVGAPGAWQRLHDRHGPDAQFGSADVVIAVVDQGIKSVGGVPENPDFQGTVSDGRPKVFRLFDFKRMVAHNDSLSSGEDHGVACAGVAAGLANNPPGAAVGSGVAGAAPNARLMGLVFPAAEDRRHQMYVWAAGLDARSADPRFPPQLERGADVITCSIGFGSGSALPASARDMFDHITTRGRNGKGCLALFSAGNDNFNIENHRPYGSYERSFSCAASSLNPSRQEIRAPYSGWGRVAWCAPSHSKYPVFHNPPASFATWTASFLNQGNLPSTPSTLTSLVDDANPGQQRLRVASVAGLSVGSRLLVGAPGTNGSEPVTVNGTPNPTTGIVPVTTLLNSHRAGDVVAAGNAHHSNDFGGTSSATPLSAGVCALVLSANPRLTWVEVREILRTTAVKFDTGNTDPVGRWLDENGDPSHVSNLPPVFSRWYGYGRLDADAAVRAALDYDFPRDLMIRKTLDDTGETPSDASADSPDIWVRNADPALDDDALPGSYDEPGPHQHPASAGRRWIYARVRNRGTRPSLDAWVRFYVASSTGEPFEHPADWEPRNGRTNHNPHDWERGTYLIGEVALPHIEGGADFIVNTPWPDALVPPALAPDGRPWDPHILVEVTPHDGPLEGSRIHENNNLAEKALTVTDDLTLVGHDADEADS